MIFYKKRKKYIINIKYHKYFGTDVIRGTLSKFPITYNFIIKLVIVIGKIFLKKKYHNIIIQYIKISRNMITNIISHKVV
ncbi:hypothetical protein GJU05_01580 [Enterobacteriaceae endosymbiont of Donacia fulgens]|uniref:hypothetical protein n=1 Tax=Enterobacteriaceae endosymbiont of Donacia fulgens TaxID=2675778 RepID=UPI001449165C|nr:hypothetical protein [Enterobacteriaceae endosymbiont of Donacia fulgens]QJC38645.1 hypothetical protein GJU05_01580 [Enterobacteriaceae endosymbiont of Donacia fulgens]